MKTETENEKSRDQETETETKMLPGEEGLSKSQERRDKD
jgi:hypothetical protein